MCCVSTCSGSDASMKNRTMYALQDAGTSCREQFAKHTCDVKQPCIRDLLKCLPKIDEEPWHETTLSPDFLTVQLYLSTQPILAALQRDVQFRDQQQPVQQFMGKYHTLPGAG